MLIPGSYLSFIDNIVVIKNNITIVVINIKVDADTVDRIKAKLFAVFVCVDSII